MIEGLTASEKKLNGVLRRRGQTSEAVRAAARTRAAARRGLKAALRHRRLCCCCRSSRGGAARHLGFFRGAVTGRVDSRKAAGGQMSAPARGVEAQQSRG